MAPVADTVIFVDIDGVLNVGIRDHGNAPLLFNDDNCNMAQNCRNLSRFSADERECIEKVNAVANRDRTDSEAHGAEDATYSYLACHSKEHFSDVLIKRLGDIITAAGGARRLVLSSNWRKPKYASRVRRLEEGVSKHIGCEFEFDDRTALGEENGPADRLRFIGDYLEEFVATGPGCPLRVLVLDDFFVNPLNGWCCGGFAVHGAGDAEAYLRSRASGAEVSVKLLHCYDEFATACGMSVQVGSGLSSKHVVQAKAFLRNEVTSADSSQLSAQDDSVVEFKAEEELKSVAEPTSEAETEAHDVAEDMTAAKVGPTLMCSSPLGEMVKSPAFSLETVCDPDGLFHDPVLSLMGICWAGNP